MSLILAAIGFALCFYGLSPLSGSNPTEGYISPRGTNTCLIGIGILVLVGCVTVLT